MITSKNDKLAYELASTLQDLDSLTAYLGLTERFNEEFLRRTLARVMSVPDNKIKRTRGALFTFLVNQHGAPRP